MALRAIPRSFIDESGEEQDFVTAGQSVGGIKKVLSVKDILPQIVAEAEAVLRRSGEVLV